MVRNSDLLARMNRFSILGNNLAARSPRVCILRHARGWQSSPRCN